MSDSTMIDRLVAAGSEIADLEAKFDRLREALKEAVAWIEDGRFDDDYISEEWYHMAIKALEDESNEIPWEKALTNLGDPRLA